MGGGTQMTMENWSVHYRDECALRDITLEIREGVTAIIGPSGCGKSTLLRSLNRMVGLIPDSRCEGAIYLGDEDIARLEMMEVRRRVGIVFSQPNPFPMSVYDNVAYGPRIHGMKNGKLLDHLVENSLGASGFLEKSYTVRTPIEELPPLKLQQLCIARTLALGPEVLLMDEPTALLDVGDTACIEQLIGKLKEEMTIVIATKESQQASRVSDRTAFLEDGTLVEMGRTLDIFFRPKHKRTEDYVTGRYVG